MSFSPSPGTSPVPAPPSNSTNTTLSPPPPPPDTTSAPPPSSGGLPTGAFAALISGVGIGGFSVLLAVGIFFVIYRKRKKRKLDQLLNSAPSQGQNDDRPKPSVLSGVSSNSEIPIEFIGSSQGTMTYDELAAATKNFSNDNLLGQGGYGYVHKGVLSNGKVVAVKQLKAGSGQGEREFRAEVDIITHVHHRHLVSLIGYSVEGAQRLLVYEFVPNDTLEFHLHGKDRPTMTWPIRMRIALGSARGLAYLHEDCKPRIIHRDIKASNILLDEDFEAKVADFGLAKYSLDTETHVSTRVMGTFGYLAPEYAASGKLTEKSDVFSFGVVLLELITGRRPVDRAKPFLDDSMVDWARPLLSQALEEGNFDIIVDPKLDKEYDKDEMTRMMACAAACILHSARLRPKMSQVVRALEGNLPLAELNREAPLSHRSSFAPHAIPDYDTAQYNADLEKFKKIALDSGSQDQTTTEYSGITSGDVDGTGPSTSSSGGPHDTR